MLIPRLYLPDLKQLCSSSSSTTIELTDEKVLHHFVKVLRLRIDQKIELFDGLGSYIKCTIIKIDKQVIALKPDSSLELQSSKGVSITAIIPFIQKENLNFMIQKLTELGINQIKLYRPERLSHSLVKKDLTKIIEKCNVTIIGACEQSGQNFKPSLEVFENLQSAIASEKNLIFFDLDASQKVPNTITSPVSFVTGPESDFSPKEIEHLKSISNKSYTLGGNTLRAETAAIVALSILQVNLDTL